MDNFTISDRIHYELDFIGIKSISTIRKRIKAVLAENKARNPIVTIRKDLSYYIYWEKNKKANVISETARKERNV